MLIASEKIWFYNIALC